MTTILATLFSGAWGGFKRLLRLALDYPLQSAIIALLCLSGLLYLSRQDAFNDLSKEQAAHIATKVAYANAQKVSAEINKKQVARIESEYAAIAEKAESDYEKRIADNRAALDRWMRSQARQGDTSSTGASEAAPVPGEVVSGTETAIVPISDLEIVADAYAQLDALRAWALEVGKVK